MHIALVAMSGVRAHNEELTQLGLTLPGFVHRNKIIASLPSLSLLTLAALTPDHHEISYIEMADVPPEGLTGSFDLVAISTYSAQIFEAYALADSCRDRGMLVVMGGLHVTCLPEEALQHASSVVIGEGEPLWPRVVADAEAGRLESIYRTPPGLEYDLADSPIPRFDLLDPDRYNRITIQTSRGCPHRCDFCASSVLLTPEYKIKPVAKVLDEIHAIKKVWERPFIEFADDNSFVERHHYRELMKALAPERLRWFTEADIAMAQDEELLELMRDAGCRQVLIGLESPHPASLDEVETRSNWKARQRDSYLEAIETIQSYGITVNGCFILGLDGDTPDIFDDVLAFVREAGLYEVQVTFYTPFPGTPLYARLRREGRLLREEAWELCTLFDINHQPQKMSVDELQAGFLRLVETLYSQEETTRRRREFFKRYRTSPHRRRRTREITS